MMHPEIKYAVVPTKRGLEEITRGLENFLTDSRFFRCSEVAFESAFVRVRAFHDQMKSFQTIYIPAEFIAYVVEHTDRPSAGFSADSFRSRTLAHSDPGGTLPPDD